MKIGVEIHDTESNDTYVDTLYVQYKFRFRGSVGVLKFRIRCAAIQMWRGYVQCTVSNINLDFVDERVLEFRIWCPTMHVQTLDTGQSILYVQYKFKVGGSVGIEIQEMVRSDTDVRRLFIDKFRFGEEG